MKLEDHQFDEWHNLLKREIQETFGKKIHSSGDCLQLSDEIYNKVSFRINANTLRRFFGLVKSDFRPSSTTREILSKYCGFNSFHDLIHLNGKSLHTPGEEVFYSDSILNYLICLFKNVTTREPEDKTFASVVKQVIIFLNRHPDLIDRFQRAIAKTRNGQHYYYEQFINLDKLNSYYGNGLRYYLEENANEEAQVFGHSLLCLRHWLSMDPEGVRKHHDQLIKHQLLKPPDAALQARLLASQVLFAHSNGSSLRKIITKAQTTYISIQQKNFNPHVSTSFGYILSPVLLFAGQEEAAMYFINYGLIKHRHKNETTEKGYHETMLLLKALVLYKGGNKKEAAEIFKVIRTADFNFFTKKTDTIMYLLLSRCLNKIKPEEETQLNELITETGFSRFNEICK